MVSIAKQKFRETISWLKDQDYQGHLKPFIIYCEKQLEFFSDGISDPSTVRGITGAAFRYLDEFDVEARIRQTLNDKFNEIDRVAGDNRI